jgi:hypothetical protein
LALASSAGAFFTPLNITDSMPRAVLAHQDEFGGSLARE